MLLAVLLGTALTGSAHGHPEFQEYVRESSGRNVDCALCHSHSNGPDGLKPGQIGNLDSDGFALLAKARGAFEPGQDVHSPILNEFGNHIVHTIGKKAVLDFRQDPEGLAEALGFESDLDEDGIADAQEYLDGTHPLIRDSGRPMKLFLHNISQTKFHIVMIALATLFGLYGLNNMMRWFELISHPDKPGNNNTGKE